MRYNKRRLLPGRRQTGRAANTNGKRGELHVIILCQVYTLPRSGGCGLLSAARAHAEGLSPCGVLRVLRNVAAAVLRAAGGIYACQLAVRAGVRAALAEAGQTLDMDRGAVSFRRAVSI